MFAAAGPFWPCVTSNETFCPSFSDLYPLIWIELWCAKRSLPPSSGVMNPKPFESLNHFTVPFAMFSFLFCLRGESGLACGHDIKGTELPLQNRAVRHERQSGRRTSLLEVHCGAHINTSALERSVRGTTWPAPARVTLMAPPAQLPAHGALSVALAHDGLGRFLGCVDRVLLVLVLERFFEAHPLHF